MPIDKELILTHFRSRHGKGPNHVWSDMTYILMRVILSKVEFESIEQLAWFCDDPNNLLPWVASETDRTVFSGKLAEGVRAMMSQAGSNAGAGG